MNPPYLRIVAEIRRRIETGELSEGDRVPSTRRIAQEWGVAMVTATRALDTLRQQGLVRTVPRVGTVVAESRPVAPKPRQVRERDHELTREHVVDTAIRIADAEGFAALSMRRLATELGVATMSVYRYVRGKEDLVLLMIDAVMGAADLPDPRPHGWRAQFEAIARIQWAMYRQHLWLAQVMSFSRPPLAPNGMAITEWTLAAIDGMGLDSNTMLEVVIGLHSHVRGTAVNLEPEAEAVQDSGVTQEEWFESHDSLFDEIMSSGRFPIMSRMSAEPDFDLDLDKLFESGLQRILDGIEVLLARTRS